MRANKFFSFGKWNMQTSVNYNLNDRMKRRHLVREQRAHTVGSDRWKRKAFYMNTYARHEFLVFGTERWNICVNVKVYKCVFEIATRLLWLCVHVFTCYEIIEQRIPKTTNKNAKIKHTHCQQTHIHTSQWDRINKPKRNIVKENVLRVSVCEFVRRISAINRNMLVPRNDQQQHKPNIDYIIIHHTLTHSLKEAAKKPSDTTHSLSQNEWEHYSDAPNGYLMFCLCLFFNRTRAHTIAAATATDCFHWCCLCFHYIFSLLLRCHAYNISFNCVRVCWHAKASLGSSIHMCYIHMHAHTYVWCEGMFHSTMTSYSSMLVQQTVAIVAFRRRL